MTAFVTRPATIADAAAIAAIHCASWRDAYAHILDATFLNGPIEQDRQSLWSRRLSEPDPSQIVHVACERKGGVVGFTCAYRDHDDFWGSLIDNIHISPTARGRRCGEQMLRALAADLASGNARARAYLWVFDLNKGARRFYDRLGGVAGDSEPSSIPAARGAVVTRISWPDIRALTLNTHNR